MPVWPLFVLVWPLFVPVRLGEAVFPPGRAGARPCRTTRSARTFGSVASRTVPKQEEVASMPWTWRYEKNDGALVSSADLPEAIFASQGDAESWLGENWRGLLEAGVDQVTLLEDDRKEYGPMSLHPAN